MSSSRATFLKSIVTEGYFTADHLVPTTEVYTIAAAHAAYGALRDEPAYWLAREQDKYVTALGTALADEINGRDVIELGGFESLDLAPVFAVSSNFSSYTNVDISAPALATAEENMRVHGGRAPRAFVESDFFASTSWTERSPSRASARSMFLMGNTFNNFYPDRQALLLTQLRSIMRQGDRLYLYFDRRREARDHLACYDTKSCQRMLTEIALRSGFEKRSFDDLRPQLVFDGLGIHAGYQIANPVFIGERRLAAEQFVEVWLSAKYSVEMASELVRRCGFKPSVFADTITEHSFMVACRRDDGR